MADSQGERFFPLHEPQRVAISHRQNRRHQFAVVQFLQCRIDGLHNLLVCRQLGCYLLYVPDHAGPLKEIGGKLLPDESQCHMRRRIQPKDGRSFVARFFKQNAPKDVWCIDENGGNLTSTIEKVRSSLLDKGLQWFSRFAEPQEVLRIFTSVPQNTDELWGFGNNPSPHRSYCLGYAALRSGQHELAITHLNSAIASGCYSAVENQLHAAVHAAAQQAVPADRKNTTHFSSR